MKRHRPSSFFRRSLGGGGCFAIAKSTLSFFLALALILFYSLLLVVLYGAASSKYCKSCQSWSVGKIMRHDWRCFSIRSIKINPNQDDL
jgi:hypothetical protein